MTRVKGDHQEMRTKDEPQGQGCPRLGISPRLAHKQPHAVKQRWRETERTKESFNAGKIRKPQGLAVTH